MPTVSARALALDEDALLAAVPALLVLIAGSPRVGLSANPAKGKCLEELTTCGSEAHFTNTESHNSPEGVPGGARRPDGSQAHGAVNELAVYYRSRPNALESLPLAEGVA